MRSDVRGRSICHLAEATSLRSHVDTSGQSDVSASTEMPRCVRSVIWVFLCTEGIRIRASTVLHSSDDVMLKRIGGRRGPAGNIELGEDIADMTGHGFLADSQRLRDGAIGLAARD